MSPQEEAKFLAEVRRFLDEALTEDLRAAGRDTAGVHSEVAACREWHRRLYTRGWIAPAWPKAFGGADWAPQKRILFDRECAARDAPVLFAGGIRNVGPLLIAMGTPRQREKYLPTILDGSEFWCQGFSEPQAGSDLANLRTSARRQGEYYILNGSKIWTTGAQFSERMFCPSGHRRARARLERRDGGPWAKRDCAATSERKHFRSKKISRVASGEHLLGHERNASQSHLANLVSMSGRCKIFLPLIRE